LLPWEAGSLSLVGDINAPKEIYRLIMKIWRAP
jgi:hypothetical protein